MTAVQTSYSNKTRGLRQRAAAECGRSRALPPAPRRHPEHGLAKAFGVPGLELRYEADPDYQPVPEEP